MLRISPSTQKSFNLRKNKIFQPNRFSVQKQVMLQNRSFWSFFFFETKFLTSLFFSNSPKIDLLNRILNVIHLQWKLRPDDWVMADLGPPGSTITRLIKSESKTGHKGVQELAPRTLGHDLWRIVSISFSPHRLEKNWLRQKKLNSLHGKCNEIAWGQYYKNFDVT